MDSVDGRGGSLQQRSHHLPYHSHSTQCVYCNIQMSGIPLEQQPVDQAAALPPAPRHLMAHTTLPESIQTTGEPRAHAAVPGCTTQPCSRHMWSRAEAALGSQTKSRRSLAARQNIPRAQMFGKASSGGRQSRAASPRCDTTRNVCKHHLAEVRCLFIAFKGRRDWLLVLAGSNG